MAAMVVVPTVVLSLLELALALSGIGYPTDFLVKSTDGRNWSDNYKFAWRFFPKQLARTQQPIVVLKDKEGGVRRIVVLGGSAAMGDPEPAVGMPRILQVLLETRFPDTRFDVVNAAVTAVNSHVVLSIAKDCQALEPDAWIVYMGNNEVHGPYGAGTVFGSTNTPRWMIRSGLALQRTRLGQAIVGMRNTSTNVPQHWGGLEMFLQSQVPADSPALHRVYENYQSNLQDLVRFTSKREAITLLTTVATNLRDSPPFASAASKGLQKADADAWASAYENGCKAHDVGHHEQACEFFAAARAIDPGHAELLYRYALCESARGFNDQAQKLFASARDGDTLRFRADSTINQKIRAVAEQLEHHNVHLMDFEQHLAQLTSDGSPGGEFFHEHVHLNFRGNYELAKLYATQLAETWNLQPTEDTSSTWLSQEECERKLGFSIWHQLKLNREMQSRFSVPPFTQQCFHEQRLAALQRQAAELASMMTPEVRSRTISDFQTLLAENPDDWVLRELYSQLLESVGQLESATSQFEQITRLLPHRPEGHFHLGRLLNKQKKWKLAEASLRRALDARPDFARAANSLGIALSQQRNLDLSIEWFQKAIELQPSFGEASYNWGLVLAEQGEEDAAMQRFQQAVEQDPRYYPAHDRLAKTYVSRKQWHKAAAHYQAVARLQPSSLNPQLNLGLLYVKLVDDDTKSEYIDLAIEQFEKVIQLDPNHQYAISALQHLNGLKSNTHKTTAEQ